MNLQTGPGSLLARFRRVWAEEGLAGTSSRIWRRARNFVGAPILGLYRLGVPAAVQVRHQGILVPLWRRKGEAALARFFGSRFNGDDPLYEDGLMRGLRQEVRAGDRIVVVGGGLGVTTAVAAQLAGPQGHVMCFEGGAQQVADVRQTLEMAGLADRVTINHSFVGSASRVYGSTEGAFETTIDALPDCDVLELDCEGSERLIIPAMSIRPRTILVECHGIFGSPPEVISAMLVEKGYEVADLGIAEPSHARHCERVGIRVLNARRHS